MLRITVPSQRKVDGHVRYKIELRRDAELVNAPCEKRFSEIHALKDEVKAALGETLYHKAFGESGHAFPSKWAQNPAEKLQGWLQNLVRLLATSRNSSRGATFENRALDFLCTTRDAAFPRGRGKARLVDVPRAARQQHERRERRERQQRGDERRHHRGDDRASQEPRGQRAAHTKAPRGGKRGARLPGDARIELHRLRRAVQLQPINMFERLHFRPENRRSMLNCNRPDMCGSMSRAAAASRCAPAGFGIASAVAP